jgi:hypothetical protein
MCSHYLFVVVVYTKTHGYCRACLIHTDPTMDHFMEIGCAQGQTCYRIHNNNNNHHSQDQRNNNIIHNSDGNNRKRDSCSYINNLEYKLTTMNYVSCRIHRYIDFQTDCRIVTYLNAFIYHVLHQIHLPYISCIPYNYHALYNCRIKYRYHIMYHVFICITCIKCNEGGRLNFSP